MIMGPARGTIKLSLFLLYRRSFLGRTFRHLNTVFLSLTTFYTVTYPFIIIFSCGTHFEALFGSFAQRAANCSHVPYINIYLDCMNLLLDLIVFVSPMPSIWKLQMQLSKKIAISGVFAVSALAVAAAAVSTGLYLWLAYPPSGSLDGFLGLPELDAVGTGAIPTRDFFAWSLLTRTRSSICSILLADLGDWHRPHRLMSACAMASGASATRSSQSLHEQAQQLQGVTAWQKLEQRQRNGGSFDGRFCAISGGSSVSW